MFRQTYQGAVAAAAEVRRRDADALYYRLIYDPDYSKLVYQEAFRERMPRAKFVEEAVKTSVETSTNLLNAATILFAHSMVDGAAFDYCKVTALHAPQDWELEVVNKQATLSDIRAKTFEEIRWAKIESLLEDLEMQSLEKKIDRLHARCRPPQGWSPMHGYVFDLDRIKGLDRLRQDIVHGEALGRTIESADEEFQYMNSTCWYFMGLVNLRYDLRIDPQLTFTRGV